jgi:hypothetical protein
MLQTAITPATFIKPTLQKMLQKILFVTTRLSRVLQKKYKKIFQKICKSLKLFITLRYRIYKTKEVIMELIGELFVINLFYSFIIGIFSILKGTSFWQGFILSLLFTPFVAIICIYINQKK